MCALLAAKSLHTAPVITCYDLHTSAAGTVEGVSFQPRDIPVGPVSFKLGSGQLIPGLEDALIGMQQGGKRRVLVPPELGYTMEGLEPQPPTFATKRQLENHKREPLLFEIELLKVRS
jgi:FKBP-type peptidyl-prolyl cis-trans isomerase